MPLDNLPQLARQIRKVFIEQTEKLADMALENDKFTIGDIADAVKLYYTALPKNFFGRPMQKPRPKSVNPPTKKQRRGTKVIVIKEESSSEENSSDDYVSPLKT